MEQQFILQFRNLTERFVVKKMTLRYIYYYYYTSGMCAWSEIGIWNPLAFFLYFWLVRSSNGTWWTSALTANSRSRRPASAVWGSPWVRFLTRMSRKEYRITIIWQFGEISNPISISFVFLQNQKSKLYVPYIPCLIVI